jgi:hypothetical protein
MLKLATTLKRSTERDTIDEAKVLLQKCIQGFEAAEVCPFGVGFIWRLNSIPSDKLVNP